MNYIIFDLEWNQSYNRDYENERIPFEIIEIGAIKLDSKFNIIDSYSSLIKPRLYKKLHPHIKPLLNFDEKDFLASRPFDMVCREFLKWCGDDFIFGTWGPMDLYYLQNNMEYYHMNPYTEPVRYYNIQQIYSDITNTKATAKLEFAVNELNIDIDPSKPFHSAECDAYYTALILKKLKPKDISDRYSYDVYNCPKDKESEIVTYHKNYMEYISRGFDTKPEALEDKDITMLRCCKCGKKASKKIKWFANTQNSYSCVGKCFYHGLMQGKIKYKQNKDGKVFVIKTVSPTNKKGMDELRARQDELRVRRQQKRHNKKDSDIIAQL